MKVKREINIKRYLMAGVLTLLIFTVGLLLGVVFENYRVQSLQKESQIQEINFKSNQLSYVYLSSLADQNTSCIALKISLEKSIKDLSKSLETIENYKQGSNFNDQEYEILSRRYLLDNLNYWILSKKTTDTCSYNTVNLLYFYDSNCEICPNQGIILTYYKKKLGDNLLVFPINTNFVKEEPMIKLLLTVYNVTEYPSIVIDDKVYKGIVSQEELHGILCEKYNMTPTECEGLLD